MFKYYYSHQSEQFTFYRIPKALFTDERFLALLSDSKVLYGLMHIRRRLFVEFGFLAQYKDITSKF
jgi:Replication initiator protein A (RepA) N-terminus.